jgi:hypothetical protein
VEGDAAGGYNPMKVQTWRRQLVFVKPDWLVVHDVIESGRPDYPKTLRVHTPDSLVLSGRAANSTETGAPLKIWSLLPEGSGTAIAGGTGKTFIYGGNDWSGPEPYNNQYGTAWRLEVTQSGERMTEFLTVLNLGGGGEAVQAESDNGTAVELGGRYKVEFAAGPGGAYSITGKGITYAINGTVSDGGMAVEGARVTLSGTGSGSATTDRHGCYSFTGLVPGEYSVGLAGAGDSRNVTISGSSVGEVDFD